MAQDGQYKKEFAGGVFSLIKPLMVEEARGKRYLTVQVEFILPEIDGKNIINAVFPTRCSKSWLKNSCRVAMTFQNVIDDPQGVIEALLDKLNRACTSAEK